MEFQTLNSEWTQLDEFSLYLLAYYIDIDSIWRLVTVHFHEALHTILSNLNELSWDMCSLLVANFCNQLLPDKGDDLVIVIGWSPVAAVWFAHNDRRTKFIRLANAASKHY